LARLALWCFFLWRVPRQELRVVPTHPDRAGGLGFLEVVHVECTPLVLAISASQFGSLDWVKLAEGQGMPATRATTAEEFHQQFAAAMSSEGPHLIAAQVAVTIQPMVDQIRKGRK
jgi:thiamine pyrophosphate-dependent acetolactate synthase large subunit-like protein